jgi:prophage regulatory protein
MPEFDRILRLKAVAERTGLSRSTIYRKVQDASFPAQLRISENGIGWTESSIAQWMKDPPSYRAQKL